MADRYLPHVIRSVPVAWVIGHDGELLPRVKHYVRSGTVRIIAGAETAHVVVNLRRPYYRPRDLRITSA